MAATRTDGPSYSDRRYRPGYLQDVADMFRDYHFPGLPKFRSYVRLDPSQIRDLRGTRNRIVGQQVRYFDRNYQPLHDIRSVRRRLGGP